MSRLIRIRPLYSNESNVSYSFRRAGEELRRGHGEHDHRCGPGHRLLQLLQQPHRLRLHERELQEELRGHSICSPAASRPAERRRSAARPQRALLQTPQNRGLQQEQHQPAAEPSADVFTSRSGDIHGVHRAERPNRFLSASIQQLLRQINSMQTGESVIVI